MALLVYSLPYQYYLPYQPPHLAFSRILLATSWSSTGLLTFVSVFPAIFILAIAELPLSFLKKLDPSVTELAQRRKTHPQVLVLVLVCNFVRSIFFQTFKQAFL